MARKESTAVVSSLVGPWVTRKAPGSSFVTGMLPAERAKPDGA